MYDDILNEVISSSDMANYLSDGGLWRSVDYIEDIIFHAPIPITRKKVLLNQVSEDVETDKENFANECSKDVDYEHKKWRHQFRLEEFNRYMKMLNIALECMDKQGVFIVHSCEYNPKLLGLDLSFEYIFSTYAEANEYIKTELKDVDMKDISNYFYTIEYWDKNSEGKYETYCSYDVINGEACYVGCLNDSYANQHELLHDRREINVAVPFMAGDIIEVNPAPYAPKYRALVTNIDDNWDCCAVQVLTCNQNGKWDVGALKHNQVETYTYPFISPLYSARVYDECLSDDEKILNNLSRYIDGSEERGKKLWNYVVKDETTTERLDDFFCNV